MVFYWIFTVRNSTIGSGDNRVPGLVAGWNSPSQGVIQISPIGASPTPHLTTTLVSIIDAGLGIYYAAYDPEANGNGDVVAQVDMDPTQTHGLTNGSDRYVDLVLTRESPVLLQALPAVAPGGAGGLPLAASDGSVNINMAQAMPASPSTTSLGGFLRAIRAWTAGTRQRLDGNAQLARVAALDADKATQVGVHQYDDWAAPTISEEQ